MVGFFIGTTATLFGIFLGVTFSIYIEKIRFFLSSIFNISLFPEEIYFLSKMPSEINVKFDFYNCTLFYICNNYSFNIPSKTGIKTRSNQITKI